MAGKRNQGTIEIIREYNENADDGAIFSELFKKVLGIDRKFVSVKKDARQVTG